MVRTAACIGTGQIWAESPNETADPHNADTVTERAETRSSNPSAKGTWNRHKGDGDVSTRATQKAPMAPARPINGPAASFHGKPKTPGRTGCATPSTGGYSMTVSNSWRTLNAAKPTPIANPHAMGTIMRRLIGWNWMFRTFFDPAHPRKDMPLYAITVMVLARWKVGSQKRD